MVKKPDFKLPFYNARLFTWGAMHSKNQGVVEASDISPHRLPHAQVWNDSCDVGFFVYSSRTDTMKLFTHAERITDKTGEEVLGDRYVADDGQFEVVIFND